MKSDAKVKSNISKPVVVTVSTADFKKKGRAGLTLREYKELSAKDRSTLTKSQKKQLAQAHEQLRKMAESITSQYDFSAMTKAIEGIYRVSPAFQSLQALDTSPMLKIVADMQKTTLAMQPALDRAFGIQASIAPAIEAIYKSSLFTQNQFTALAAIQKSLVTFPTENIIASIKSIQDAFQAPLIAKTMFADFHTAHERILRNLRFDVGSLTASIEFRRFETVDVALDDVITKDDNLSATATATQTSNAGNITFVDNASMVLAFNDLRQEVHDLNRQLLARDNQQGQQLIAPSTVSFKRSTTSLQIGSFNVRVSISSKQTLLARTILTSQDNIAKRWDVDDLIYAAFGERIADDELDWIKKVRSYLFQLNQKVMLASNGTMPNYFVLEGIEVFVNPEYI
jgi:cell wall-associated NlpC family hydrolase